VEPGLLVLEGGGSSQGRGRLGSGSKFPLSPSTGIALRLKGHHMTQYEYLARNLKKVAGMMIEKDFNKHGAEGWKFVAVADEYAIFIREKS
jgi:hypothetical protein